jgi:hypothetical protein
VADAVTHDQRLLVNGGSTFHVELAAGIPMNCRFVRFPTMIAAGGASTTVEMRA